ncbi:CSLREA domain-containing protein [Acinetobacter rudis]|uniref:CSLREA domain-containing protein n=1 Tax=Acinetobacter rudis CIP 110305 TaxID=421052 RepID=S3MVD5_9GAMM|nr:CSLREA domain-containing protein [Acinetobacter rudis]EPF71492.1 hypothetical protein F945_02521 [Acinetobacter rudis CIP 110305]
MIQYKKTALVVATLTLMSLSLSAQTADRTIYVTTFADEDGENSNACSLREAIVTASTGKAYGGCPVGEVVATRATVIQLEAGEYQLKRELQPTQNVVIQGKAPVNYEKPDVLTNDYPALTAIQTKIRAVANNRILNSSTFNQPAVTIDNVELYDGVSTGRGGALLAGGALILNNVSIFNSKAQEGGAVYLDGVYSSFTANRGRIEGNQAERGSVIAMSCSDNLTTTVREVYIDFMSILNNGSANSQSTFAYCGQAKARISASSIGLNQADPTRGSIIQFSSKTPYGNVPLSVKNTSLELLSNTITQNTAFSTLLYDGAGKKDLNFNVLAFNTGKSCRYADKREGVKYANIYARGNAVLLKAGHDECELISEDAEAVAKDNIAVDQYSFNQLLSPLSQNTPDEYTAYMPMYFTKPGMSNNPLIDSKFESGCSNLDQRGIKRINVVNSVGNDEKPNTCDIGATEVLRLTTSNLTAANPSIVDLLKEFEAVRDSFDAFVKNPQTKPEFLPYYKLQVEKYAKLRELTEAKQKYRTVFIDPFKGNWPDETVSDQGVREIKHLSADLYDVSYQALGVGKLDSDNKFQGQFDQNLKCEWDKDLEQILMYRLDDRITPDGDTEFCSYKLTMKSNPAKSSSAYIMVSFRNIEPVAEPVSYTVSPGDTGWTELKLLENTHDKGDGDVSKLQSKPNKLSYYTDEKGQDLAIRFTQTRDAVQIQSERSGPCPDDVKLTCHGGKIQAKLKNTFDPFNYRLKYLVYDVEGLASKEAEIEIINTGSSKGATSGGGSVGMLSTLALLTLVYLRRRASRVK